jgi:4-amino-4-deoxy-L-arabinose transferase-like glycosyltransferase
MTRLLTFERLKWASFTHSAVYTVLLVVWLVPGLAPLEAIFGMAHGLGWIAMSLACLVALRLRVIDLRLAVAVAVLGGVGPFIGSLEFVRQSRMAGRGRDRRDGDGVREVSPAAGVPGTHQ